MHNHSYFTEVFKLLDTAKLGRKAAEDEIFGAAEDDFDTKRKKAKECVETAKRLLMLSHAAADTESVDRLISQDNQVYEAPESELSAETVPDISFDIDRAIFVEQVEALVDAWLNGLNPKDKEIIQQRFGLAGKEFKRVREIAAEMKVSPQYISYLERNAIFKLQTPEFITKVITIAAEASGSKVKLLNPASDLKEWQDQYDRRNAALEQARNMAREDSRELPELREE